MNALRPCRSATTLCSTLLLALASAAAPAGAQQRSTETSADTSVAALVQALSGGPVTRAFAGHTDTTGGANRRVEVRKAPE